MGVSDGHGGVQFRQCRVQCRLRLVQRRMLRGTVRPISRTARPKDTYRRTIAGRAGAIAGAASQVAKFRGARRGIVRPIPCAAGWSSGYCARIVEFRGDDVGARAAGIRAGAGPAGKRAGDSRGGRVRRPYYSVVLLLASWRVLSATPVYPGWGRCPATRRGPGRRRCQRDPPSGSGAERGGRIPCGASGRRARGSAWSAGPPRQGCRPVRRTRR